MRYSQYWPIARDRWDRLEPRPSDRQRIAAAAAKALLQKARYSAVAVKTGVPWELIAALHMRESDANFRTYLGNGEALTHKTVTVPKNRGPFSSWEAGAYDALKLDGLSSVKDWRMEKVLYYAEIYNGTGYYNRGVPSPYLYGASTTQVPGKYVKDGKWDASHWDQQIGVATLLKQLYLIDPATKAPPRET